MSPSALLPSECLQVGQERYMRADLSPGGHWASAAADKHMGTHMLTGHSQDNVSCTLRGPGCPSSGHAGNTGRHHSGKHLFVD